MIPLVAAAGDVALSKAMGGLKLAVGQLTEQLSKTWEFSKSADKASLALGVSFGETSEQFASQMNQLRGGLTERFTASFAGMEAGLQGNTGGIGKLINQQRLTGTQSAKTAGVFAKMEMTLGNSREATNALADSLPGLGAKWQTATNVLVNAIDSLAKHFPAMKLSGIGPHIADAIASLQGELGTSLSDPLNKVMGQIFDTSDKAFQNLATLGIGDVRERLAAAKTEAQATAILKDALKTASNTVKDFTAGSPDFYRLVGVAKDVFGDAALDMVTLSDAFGKRVESTADPLAKFGDQLGIIKDEIFLPLQLAFVAAFPIIKKVAILLGAHLKNAVSSLVASSIRLYLKFEAFSSVVGFTIDVLVSSFKTLSIIAALALAVMNPLLGAAALAGLIAYKTSDMSKDNARIDNMDNDALLEALRKKMEADADLLGVSLKTEENTKKTADILDKDNNTAPDFLSQSANMLGRGIEAQLGMTDNQTLVDVIAELQVANELAAAQLANSEDLVGSAPSTNSKGN